MPISVPKWAQKELEIAKNAAITAAAGRATIDLYSYVQQHLTRSGTPHQTHSSPNTVPADHVYWKP